MTRRSTAQARRAFAALWCRIVLAVLVAAAAACSSKEHRSAAGRRVTIAAAADLKFAFDQLTPAFNREHPDIEVSVSYGSSGNFYTQLLNGAPYDVFLSADMQYPRQLAEQGFVVPSSDFVYAIGRLAIWTPARSGVDVNRGLAALAFASHVAIANPAHAPYGRAAVAAMRSAGIFDQVSPKFVYGENVAQTLQLVQSGAAEVGVVALSLALAPPVSSSGRYAEVPATLFPPIEQGGAILKRTTDVDAAQAMRSFLISDAGRELLRSYGFGLPKR